MTERGLWMAFGQSVLDELAAGHRVEIDGLGTFRPDAARGFRFTPDTQPRIFIAYVTEDAGAAARLYDDLARAGFHPWMDTRKLLAGQNWARAIDLAIETADFFVACFSRHSVDKRGGFQAEIRYALDCARRIPLDQIFVLPVRFDNCRIPRSIEREWQYIDLFPDWEAGIARLARAIRQEMAGQKKLLAPDS